MTTTNQQNEFIQSLNGELTPDQAAQLLEMGLHQGDTGAPTPDELAQPGADANTEVKDNTGGDTNTEQASGKESGSADTSKQEDGKAKPAAPVDSELTADNAVILAKDGKHTIPFERLTQARDGEKHWREVAQAAERKLADLQAAATARAEAGEAPTKTDNQLAAAQAAMDAGADPAIFGDFSEQDLAKGIQTLIDQRVAESVAKALEPVKQKEAVDATTMHFQAIYDKHPDADSIAESKELADWIASKPAFMRPSLQSVLEKGSTAEIVEFFDTFKLETGVTRTTADTGAGQGADALQAARNAARKAIESAAPKVPASLSDFPGGRAAGLTRDEQLAQLNGQDLLDAMQSGNMNPDQIERFLNNL